MPPVSALYVNVYATPRPWVRHAISGGGFLVACVAPFSHRAADLLGRAVLWLCVRFGVVVEVRR